MPSRRIYKELNTGIYFLRMTVHRWYYLFDRHHRWKILADSIRFCQDNKGLTLHAYVFRLNHILLWHQMTRLVLFVISKNSPRNNFGLILNGPDRASSVIWMKTNAPQKIENGDFYWQKMEYIHNNPVRKGYVVKPEHWLWSSASPNSSLVVTKLET